MTYRNQNLRVPQGEREVINRNVLSLVRSGDMQGLSREDIFNAYTGRGGLHGLTYSDFANFSEYSNAKRQREGGQFFTPDWLAAKVVQSLGIENDELVLDASCGHGALFNHIPNPGRLYGNELDEDAYRVCEFLFPDAQVTRGDFALYRSLKHFDVMVSNPPFAVPTYYQGETRPSHEVYLSRCEAWLKPGGLLVLIVPASFLSDAFHHQSKIEELNRSWRFLGQFPVPDSAFSGAGVAAFPTKVMFLQRSSQHLAPKPYRPKSFGYAMDDVAPERIYRHIIRPARAAAKKVRAAMLLEQRQRRIEDQRHVYKIDKMLYHIKSGKAKAHYAECKALVEQFLTQVRPDYLNQKEWDEQRLELDDVLAKLKNTLKTQHRIERDELRLVKTQTGFKYKGYDKKTRAEAAERDRYPFYCLTGVPAGFEGYRRTIKRRLHRRAQHEGDLQTRSPDPAQVKALQAKPLYKETLGRPEAFHLNNVQAADVARLVQRDYAFFQADPGTGKTAQCWLWSREKAAPYTLILSTDLSIRQTWQPFLSLQGVAYQLLDKQRDVDTLAPGVLLLTFDRMKSLYPQLKRALRGVRSKLCLIVDEADELASYTTTRTKNALALFRRARYKLCATGTATRNAVHEIYPPAELLFNNGDLMLCNAPFLYKEDKSGALQPEHNPYWERPFPAQRGYTSFCQAFSPKRVTVFGIFKDTQDVYQLEELETFLAQFRLTRTFREVVGEDKAVPVQHLVSLSAPELELQNALIKELHTFLRYFKDTGNARKESALRAVRQLTLLRDMTCGAHRFKEYSGTQPSSKMQKAKAIVAAAPGKVLIGVLRKNLRGDYLAHWKRVLSDLGRPVWTVSGDLSAQERGEIVQDEFHASTDGILVATQTSLPSSIKWKQACHRRACFALYVVH